ncbi:MAG: hypothetical protein CVV42_02925 [Candidatus Riflebacteria bacterium HGW-Riflebacteria-2]|jgi:proline dehydrogenase|nr:MAG: hypothetical protein CVV42_02925 [Candidatus Riflebacteria bacterium HGW-Riflebacteria-2]
MTDQNDDRWALPGIAEALQWLDYRNQQGISIALDALGEYAKDTEQAAENLAGYRNCLLALPPASHKVAVAIKLSALGLNFDAALAETNLQNLLELARNSDNLVEIDIEGTPTVEATVAMACKFATMGLNLVLALQAYLDRTDSDIRRALEAGLKIRLVKGAYRGDTDDFTEIQSRFFSHFKTLLATGRPFDVGTHDPLLIEQMKTAITERSQVCFGFLKGLADQTKLNLAQSGFGASEYVPYGTNRKAYVARRQLYLKNLEKTGLTPAP